MKYQMRNADSTLPKLPETSRKPIGCLVPSPCPEKLLESICNSDKIVESNVREVKVHSPDYQGKKVQTIF
jgi:hypothetical protein